MRFPPALRPHFFPRPPPWICAAALALVCSACASTIANRSPIGERFPAVEGTSLAGDARELPADLGGQPAVLLLGYVMKAQFDLDRWLVGLADLGTPVDILEVPTVRGLVPGLISGTIDAGMQSGIPAEDWAQVVTLYGDDAARIVEWTGNERPRNGRVALVDGDGRVVWFHDRGFSAGQLLELDRAARSLVQGNTMSKSDGESVEREVRELLDSQAAAWNRGDLEQFLELGYWRDDRLAFFSGGSVTRGFDTVAARYRQRYLTDGATMGRLTFADVEVEPLAPGLARASGRWGLVHAAAEPAGGLFTLLLRELPEGWRIVFDHTSSDG
ncbi:MAG: DUF4440 domain-containing protein [Planctomycetaceae bacterium]|nr:DUF4440 domain-containing protein [Planctomycetaceae bacterium]